METIETWNRSIKTFILDYNILQFFIFIFVLVVWLWLLKFLGVFWSLSPMSDISWRSVLVIIGFFYMEGIMLCYWRKIHETLSVQNLNIIFRLIWMITGILALVFALDTFDDTKASFYSQYLCSLHSELGIFALVAMSFQLL